MTPKKKITTIKDILAKNQKQRDQSGMPGIKKVMTNIDISPQLIQNFAKALEEEQERRRGGDKVGKVKKSIGSVFAILVMIAAILGVVWLIKFLIGGIFG